MEGNIVSAAKWLGGCLLVSSVVLVCGIHLALSASTKTMGVALQRSQSNAHVWLHHQFHQSEPTFKVKVSGELK